MRPDILIPILALGASPVLAQESCGDMPAETTEIAEARLIIEYNHTEGAIGVHGYGDDDGWSELCVSDRGGALVLYIDPRAQLGELGLGSFFFESREPPEEVWDYAALKAAFSEANYVVPAKLRDGTRRQGSACFTTLVPQPPVITAPALRDRSAGAGGIRQPDHRLGLLRHRRLRSRVPRNEIRGILPLSGRALLSGRAAMSRIVIFATAAASLFGLLVVLEVVQADEPFTWGRHCRRSVRDRAFRRSRRLHRLRLTGQPRDAARGRALAAGQPSACRRAEPRDSGAIRGLRPERNRELDRAADA